MKEQSFYQMLYKMEKIWNLNLTRPQSSEILNGSFPLMIYVRRHYTLQIIKLKLMVLITDPQF